MMRLLQAVLIVTTLLAVLPARGAQRLLLGAHPDDRFLSGFWAQQLTTSNLMAGVNANAPASLTWTAATIPTLLTNLSLKSATLRGDSVITNSATLTVLSDGLVRLATNATLVLSNGATLQDDTGGLSANLKLSADASTLTRYSDVSNIVDLINTGAGLWPALTWFSTGQFDTNDGSLAIKSGAAHTNALVYGLQLQAGLRQNFLTKSTNYTLTTNDAVILANATGGNLTFTLPAVADASGVVFQAIKKDSSGNTVTLDGNASETINGATTQVLSTQYQSTRILCDGVEWFVLD